MSKSIERISVVAASTVVSRVLGLVRDVLITAIFGTSALASAFFTAFNLPNLFRRLLAEGSMTAAFVPTLNDRLEQGGRKDAFVLLSQVVSWLLVVSSAVVVPAMLLFSYADVLGPRLDAAFDLENLGGRLLLGADLTVILFPYLIFVCLAAALSATLQSLGRFLEPALSSIWLNLAMIGFLGGSAWLMSDDPRVRMNWLCAGVLVGGFLQMAVPAVVLMRQGWKPRVDLRLSPGVREIARLMAPGLFGTAIYQINIFVSRMLAFGLNDTAAAVLHLANRLMELPIGIFTISVAQVVFPLISRHAARGDFQAMAQAHHKGLRLTLAINLPAAAGIMLLSAPIIRALFEHGQFTAEATRQTIPILCVFAAGMPFLSIVSLLTRAFYSMKDTRTPVHVATVSFLVNGVLSLVLMSWLSTVGLALASNLAVVVQAWMLQRELKRRVPGMRLGPQKSDFLKILFAVGVMAAVVGGGWQLASSWLPPGQATDVGALFVLIPLGGGLYAAALWFLRIEGRDEVGALLAKLRARLGR